MLKNIKVVEPSMDEWDIFTKEQLQGHLLQSASWGVLERKRSFKSIQLAVRDDASGKFLAGISILIRSIPGTGKTIFYAPRGPIIDHDTCTLEYFNLLVLEIKKIAAKEKGVFLKVDPAVSFMDPVVSFLHKTGFMFSPVATTILGTQPKVTLRLNLNQSEEYIFSKFHQKHRQYIRKNQREDILVRVAASEELPELIKLLALWQVGGVSKTDAFYKELFHLFPLNAVLFVAERSMAGRASKKEVVAMRMLITWGSKAWEFYGVRNPKAGYLRASYLLVWEMIKGAKEKGCLWYDFRGIPNVCNTKHPLYGIYKFKVGFGGERHEFAGELDLVFEPTWYAVWNYGLRFLKCIF